MSRATRTDNWWVRPRWGFDLGAGFGGAKISLEMRVQMDEFALKRKK